MSEKRRNLLIIVLVVTITYAIVSLFDFVTSIDVNITVWVQPMKEAVASLTPTNSSSGKIKVRPEYERYRRSLPRLDPSVPVKAFDMSKKKKIFFYHVRKAAGTGVRMWLDEQVRTYHQLNYDAQEGWVLTDAKKADWNDEVLRITVVRDPIDRIISSYFFEGRWPMEILDTEKTDETAVPFPEWMNKTIYSNTIKIDNKEYMPQCVANCMCQWFGGTRQIDYEHSREILGDFDMVLSLPELANEEYRDWLAYMVQADDANVGKLQIMNNGVYREAAKDRGFNPISEQIMKELKRTNELDAKLIAPYMYDDSASEQ